jgi:hypothetical protein
MPDDRTLLSLNASHAIPTRVLRFEESGLRRRTPVRPVLLTGQTHRLDRSGAAAAPSSVLQSWLCGSTKEPSGFLVNHWKPCCDAPGFQLGELTLMSRSTALTLVKR